MTDKKVRALLAILKGGEYHTADELAGELGVSSKTVRNLLKDMDQELAPNGARVASKYGAGYALKVDDAEAFDQFVEKAEEQEADGSYLPSTSEERIQYLLEYLFNSRDYVKMDDLSESLFISKRTLSEDLKEVERLLNRHNLNLVRKPSHGIRVEGREFDLRLCIAGLVEERIMKEKRSGEENTLRLITECITESLQSYDYQISDVAFQNLIIHIYIAIKRILEDHYVQMGDACMEDLTDRMEYEIAADIADRIRRVFSVEFPETEVAYVSIHLAGKMIAGTPPTPEENLIITQEISDLVTAMLQVIYDAFKFDFREDLELRMSLSQHLVPLTVRMEYDMNMKNPLLKDIKERFCLAYAMASHGATVINGRYHKELKEDEIGYMALAFALALERQKTAIARKNILLVCASGQGSAKLLLYKYKQAFGPYINHIETCDVRNVNQVDFKDIDYIFSTVPIPYKVPVPIQEVRYFLEDNDIDALKKMLTGQNNGGGGILGYYEEDLFLPHIRLDTREAVLEYMTYHVIRAKGLPKQFYPSVLKRERLAKTAFGNLVAMPHPYEAMSEETFVCVGILEKPIYWGRECDAQQVQVVFLVSIENKKNADLQKFYEITSKFLLSSRCIQELIKKRSFESLMCMLNKIESES